MSKLHHILKRMSGNKLFHSVLVTYLLLLVVTIVMLASGYSYSIQQARQDIEALQISFLEQVRRELDIRLSSVSRVSNFLATYPLTQSVSSIGKEDGNADYLLDYRLLDEVIWEQNNLLVGEGKTVVYFDRSDSIITGDFRYRSETLGAYTSQLGLTPDEFRAFLPGGVTKDGELRILHPGTPEAELVYMAPVLDDSLQRVGTVLTRFSMSYLKKSVSAGQWWEGSICHMRNGEDCLFIDSGGTDDAVLSSGLPDYKSVPLDGRPMTIDIGGEKYTTVGLHSSENNWDYYFSVPEKEFFGPNKVYFIMFMTVLCMSVFAGVVMSLYFTKRFSHPIQEILDSLKLDSAVDYPIAVSSMKSALYAYQKEIAVTQSQAHQNLRRKKAGFVYGLCTGRVSPDAHSCEQYGFTLEDGPVSLIVFQYHVVEGSVFIQDGFLDQDMLLYAGVNVVEELLGQGNIVAVPHEKQIICLYQPKDPPDAETLRSMLTEIYDFHKNVLQVGLRIFYTHHVERLADLPESLSITEEMSRYKMFWENDVPDILFSCEISELSDIEQPAAMGAEKRFLNLLAIGNYEEAHQVLMEQLSSGISRDLKRFQQERYKIYGFISGLLENLPASVREGDMDQWDAALSDLLTERSISGLREKVDAIFQRIIADSKQKDSSSGIPSWVKESQTYIEEHYADPQLDVSHLAKVFSLNVSYLSRTYKKSTSIGVLDNIHMIRIAKAKELLAKGCTVQETAAQVGYMESRALIRAFKRYESITPGQYQEISTQSGQE